ncbi:hypothetical protein J4733_24300 [Klebsiella pneumoniae]|uniref:Uncharacterized protein n=1 Tax=Klebsiella pneumoniae TaxID=573 RepID=A0A939NN47_KLEPN|nr:hypothetical protein [Klebsiella pneumoniae]
MTADELHNFLHGGYNSRLSEKNQKGVYLCLAAITASERDVMYFLRAVAKKPLADPARPGRSLSLIFHGDLNDSAVVKLRKISVFEHEVVAMSVSKNLWYW